MVYSEMITLTEPIFLDPEDWSPAEWDTIKKIFGYENCDVMRVILDTGSKFEIITPKCEKENDPPKTSIETVGYKTFCKKQIEGDI